MTMYDEAFFPAAKLNPLFFRSWTPDKPKMTLLYVHGAGGTSADFMPLAQQLSSEEDIRVLAFDSPANGYSQGNEGVSPFEVQRATIERLIKTAKTPVAVLASSGGAVATFMCLYMNRHKPEFNRVPVIFAEPSLGFDKTVHQYVALCRYFYSRRYRSLEDARRAWAQTPLDAILFDSEEAKTAFVRGRLRVLDNALIPLLQPFNAKPIKPFNLLTNKESLQNPALVLWGEKGGMKELYAEQLDHILTNQTKIEFPGAGHPLSLTRAVERDAIVQFIRQNVRV